MNQLVATEFKKDEEVFMNQVIESRGANLPGTIDEVVKVFEFSDLKAKAWKLLAEKTGKFEEQVELHQAAIRSGQQWGIAALYAQKKMGEITRGSKPEYPVHGTMQKMNKLGVDRSIYQNAELFSKHPDILDKVIETAKENGEIPTKTAVLKAIQHDKWVKDSETHNNAVREKYNKKMVEQVNEAVKNYFDSIKGFKSILEISKVHAEAGKFSPESKNFIIKRHNEIRKLMEQLEETI